VGHFFLADGDAAYLWFRFELIYGVAAVVAVFHDTLITVGAFSLTNQEISLTVIAAILTLIGYSMNDTIVVFDRIRENLALSAGGSGGRGEPEHQPDADTDGDSSGLTFLTVMSLFLFGGPVLRGFSFALVLDIDWDVLVDCGGAPMLVAYQDWRKSRARWRRCRRSGRGLSGGIVEGAAFAVGFGVVDAWAEIYPAAGCARLLVRGRA